jgi:DNA-binding response OmpR family regulator
MANILLADDDQTLQDLYQLKFSKAGHHVIPALDATEAITQLNVGKPDIILLDRRLGNGDGLVVLQQMRDLPNGKAVPVIILSNMEPESSDLETLKTLAPAEYKIKEKTDLNDLVSHIAQVIKS